MSKSQQIDFTKISLDLSNLRMMPQKTEKKAINVMIAIKPERFFAVIDSIIQDGYLGTENIVLLQENKKLIVKEGNRRIAALKLIHGIIKVDDFAIPDSIKEKIKKIDSKWKKENTKIPCLIYQLSELDKVNKIVSLTHGKGEKASRDPWSSVARARHNRDEKGAQESGLDLLEKYIKNGQNLTGQQKERWSGDYPITVLDEALKTLVKKCKFETIPLLIKKYPKITDRVKLEDVLVNIGLGNLGFNAIRDKNNDFTVSFGFPPEPEPNQKNEDDADTKDDGKGGTDNSGSNKNDNSSGKTDSDSSDSNKGGKANDGKSKSSGSAASPKASATNTQRHVRTLLKKFTPKGNRQKVVTLKNELLKLAIKDNPIAFCFILRSMFEISAKAYCSDKSIPVVDKKGNDKKLAAILTVVTSDLTDGNKNKGMVKILHGALNEITNPNRILSVTSMNQLVHSPNFSVQQGDICTLFSNIYPLLEAMN